MIKYEIRRVRDVFLQLSIFLDWPFTQFC